MPFGRALVFLLGGVILAGSGTLIVKAADDPRVRDNLIQFNRPIRQGLAAYLPRETSLRRETSIPRETLRLPAASRPERDPQRPAGSVREAPPSFAAPLRKALETSAPETPAPETPAPEARVVAPDAGKRVRDPAGPMAQPRRAKSDARQRVLARGAGIPFATNYCVRLVDGFAFPLGLSGIGELAQNRACRAACPGAETAIFTLPAGAGDLDQLRLGTARYAALPTAFRYRDTALHATSCKPIGATQSSAALLADLTLRQGDIVMTRIGMRHFDGSKGYPYRASAFSDALVKLPKREVAIVRAMELASVRGLIPVSASQGLRARVVEGIRLERARAERAAIVEVTGAPAGFAELRSRERQGKTILPIVKRPTGLVALN